MRRRAVGRLAERIHGCHDRNGCAVQGRSGERAADERGGRQRSHGILHGDDFFAARERRESVAHRVEPGGASLDDAVRSDFEAGGEVAPESDPFARQHHDDPCLGDRPDESIDREGQYGTSAQYLELLGYSAAAALSAAAGHDDDSGIHDAIRFGPAGLFPDGRREFRASRAA